MATMLMPKAPIAETHKVRLIFHVLDNGDVAVNGEKVPMRARTLRRGALSVSFDGAKFRRNMRAAGYSVPRGCAKPGASWEAVVERQVMVQVWECLPSGLKVSADMWTYEAGESLEPYTRNGRTYEREAVVPVFPADPHSPYYAPALFAE